MFSAILFAVILTACTQSDNRADIRFAVAQAPITLDPRYATDAASARVNRVIYRSLVDFDAQFRAAPALATWVCADDAHCRFTLGEDGRKFHDGTRLTAEDVAATYNSLRALKDTPLAAEFANIAEVKAVDENTVDFTLKSADSQFPARLIIGILPAGLIARNHDFARHPVGSGALKFVAWKRALTLERVADGQRITLEEVRDPTVRVLKLLRGEADLLQGDLPPELVADLKTRPETRVLESPGTNYSYLGFNMQDPVLRDVNVRRAVTLAIDREAIARQVLVGGSRSATAILPPEHWAGNAALKPAPYEPEIARALLTQAGVKLPLRLVYKTSTDAQRVRLATIMQAQMRPAGIELEIRSLDWGTFYDDVKHGKFQLYGLTWVGIKTPEIYRFAFRGDHAPPVGANRGHLQDAELDALIDRQDWQAVTARVDALLPYVSLWYEGQFAAMRRDVTDYAPAPDGNWDALATIKKRSEQ
ncbi:MAG: ABC transporter substrate-binding protein [Methylobacillus sp.]|nr:ABC transporter substrate-binding protein [Methylobacillus sp.]